MSALRYWWAAAVPALVVLLGPYRGDLLAQYCLLGAATSLLAFLWGRVGLLSLGHAVPFGIGAYAVGWSSLRWEQLGTVSGLVIGTLLAALVSLVVALVGLRGRVNVVPFALVTFTVVMAAAQLVNSLTDITGGFDGLNGVPRLHVGAVALTEDSQRLTTAVVVVVVLVGLVRVGESPFGGVLTMIRDSPHRAAALGYRVPLIRISVFTAIGAATGLLGGLMASQAQSVTGGDVSIALATSFVIWALLGSRTTVLGPFVVAVAINVASNELANRALDYWVLGTGLVFVVAVLAAPAGVAESLRAWVPGGRRAGARVHLDLDTRPADIGPRGPGAPALVARGVVCRFGPFVAVDEVDVVVGTGQIHCLIGPNGAGKSTLLDVLSGLTPASGGAWFLGDPEGLCTPHRSDRTGSEMTGSRPWTMARGGLRRKFQAPAVAAGLTVEQNLAVAADSAGRGLAWVFGSRWEAVLTPECVTILRAGGLDLRLDVAASALSHGQRQLLDLAMTVARRPRVVLLDEPTAGLSPTETAAVGEALRRLRDDHGASLVLVEHDIDLVRDLADVVTVLRNGRVLATGSPAEIERNAAVREAYLGAGA